MPDTSIFSASGTLRIETAPRLARLLLRGDPAAMGQALAITLPLAPCTSITEAGRTALWLGPDEWLLLAPEGSIWPDLEFTEGATIDVGHRQLAYVIDGPHAESLLAVACPLDLARAAFPPGACTRTIFGKAEIILWRRGPHTFHLEVWRSFALYVRALMAEAELDACTPSG